LSGNRRGDSRYYHCDVVTEQYPLAHAALLFAVCGAASSQVLNLDDWASYVLPVPFGIVAAWLCVGRVAPGIALVILDAVVWQLAYRIAVKFGADGPTLQRIAAMYLAGLVAA